jgi:hypothetical protein
MDVVDTLRHQESLVARELNEDQKEAELIERLRKIYRDQGIEVSDRIIQEGVKALKDSRFVYSPPRPGLGTTLARLYVQRGRYGKAAGAVAGVLAAAWLGYAALVTWPAERNAERARTEITQTLPKALDAAVAEVKAEARVPAATQRADQILADGRAALSRSDPEGARKALADLEELRADLRREYQLVIVSRPGEQTGVWRIPDRNKGARNYYVVVEAIGRDGKAIPLPVKSEEDGKMATVTKWGVRVAEPVFEAVRKDKSDDGILQRNRLGEKRRGYLDVDYAVPVLGGAITQW